MKLLEDRILQDGQVRPGNVLKVDCFLNHQLDVDLLELAGAKLDPACMLGTVGYARPAELVMVNGRVVVEHGRVLGMDEEQTRVRAQQLVDGMLQKAE